MAGFTLRVTNCHCLIHLFVLFFCFHLLNMQTTTEPSLLFSKHLPAVIVCRHQPAFLMTVIPDLLLLWLILATLVNTCAVTAVMSLNSRSNYVSQEQNTRVVSVACLNSSPSMKHFNAHLES